MKRSLLALAVLGAFAGMAHAQSSVTVYGSFDAGVRHTTNVDAAGDNRLTMSSGGTYQSNRIGFRGTEDLGGGWAARFTLEGDFNSGTGAQAGSLFGRSAWVGLTTPVGMFDFGRQYSVNFKTIGGYDPFGYKFTGIIPLATQGGLTRLNNNIQYTSKFGPVVVRAEYGLGEVAGSTSANATQALGATYSAGGITAGGAYTMGKRAVGGVQQDMDNWTVGAAFATGPFRVAGGYAVHSQEQGAGIADSDTKNAWVGGSFNVTPAAQLTAGFYRTSLDTAAGDGRRNLIIVGATYAMSKRTNLYADIDNARRSGLVQAANFGHRTQRGFSVGMNHLF